jgi:hypothetical protein
VEKMWITSVIEKNTSKSKHSTNSKVARGFIFKPKIPILVNLRRALGRKILIYFMAIWNIYGHLVYFMAALV